MANHTQEALNMSKDSDILIQEYPLTTHSTANFTQDTFLIYVYDT